MFEAGKPLGVWVLCCVCCEPSSDNPHNELLGITSIPPTCAQNEAIVQGGPVWLSSKNDGGRKWRATQSIDFWCTRQAAPCSLVTAGVSTTRLFGSIDWIWRQGHTSPMCGPGIKGRAASPSVAEAFSRRQTVGCLNSTSRTSPFAVSGIAAWSDLPCNWLRLTLDS